MTDPRIGSLFSGYGGLDIATAAVLDGTVAWHCEVDLDARRVLRARWPGVPIYGDIAAVDWTAVEPVEVVTGGFPCQTVSIAGRQAGLAPDQTDYLFERPSNWAAMHAAIAALRPRLVVIENVKGLLRANAGTVDGRRVGSAFGVVLGDLADIGYDAEWTVLRAADIGAAHGRARVFVAATDPRRGRLQRRPVDRGVPGAEGPGEGQGLQRERRRNDPRDGRPAPPDPGGEECPRRAGLRACVPPGLWWGRPDNRHLEDQPSGTWGPYQAAVERWADLIGRPAAAPTVLGPDGGIRLNPVFAEWLMGLPAGHVTDVPGIERRSQLRLLGNGVVPQQAAAALSLLLDRSPEVDDAA